MSWHRRAATAARSPGKALPPARLADARRLAGLLTSFGADRGVMVLDTELRICVLEGNVYPRHGYSAQELLGRELQDVLPRPILELTLPAFRRALAGESAEIELRSQDDTRDYRVQISPFTDPQGETVGVIAILQDISDHVRERGDVSLRLNAVAELGCRQTAGAPRDELEALAAELAREVAGADAGCVLRFVPDLSEARMVAVAGSMNNSTGAMRPNTPGLLINRVLESAAPVWVDDLRTETQVAAPLLAAQGMRSIVAVLIGTPQDPHGVLAVHSRQPGAFSAADVEFVVSLANVLAGAARGERSGRRLSHAEQRFEQAFEHAPIGMALFDAAPTPGKPFLLQVNQALCDHLGYERDQLLSMWGEALSHPDDLEVGVAQAIQLAAGEITDYTVEKRLIHADRSVLPVRLHVSLVQSDGDEPPYGVCQVVDLTDLAERRRAELELKRTQALFDQGFDNAPIGMALTEVDTHRFLRVNDAMCRITGHSRQQLLALGSFAEMTHPDDAPNDLAADERMRTGESASDQRATRYVRPDGSHVWVSRHVTPVRDRAGGLAGLFTQVVDLSEQKEREESLRRELAEATWLGHIHEAIAEDRLVLHAQPICDLNTGAVVQQELLIRMVDRDGQLIPPVRFLPIAEKLGLIMEIDKWVISQAAGLAARGMAVEVNVSADSMGRPALLDHVESELMRTGADPAKLVFEITETALMSDLEGGEAFARRMSALGCGFALDDFGTGFGGFTYLKRLPVDFIKIDREFVRDLPHSERDQHLVRTIVSLAKGLNQRTIAEGVEDQATLELLAGLGVDYGQGYHLGRPGPLAPPAAPAAARAPARPALSRDPGRNGGRPRPGAPSRVLGRRAAH